MLVCVPMVLQSPLNHNLTTKLFALWTSIFPFTFYASKQVLLQWIAPRSRQFSVRVTDAVELANVAFCEVNPELEVEDIPVLLTVVRLDG